MHLDNLYFDKLQVILYLMIKSSYTQSQTAKYSVSGAQSQTAGYPVSYNHRFWYSVTNCRLSCILSSQVLELSHKLQVILYPMSTGSGTQSQTAGYPVSYDHRF